MSIENTVLWFKLRINSSSTDLLPLVANCTPLCLTMHDVTTLYIGFTEAITEPKITTQKPSYDNVQNTCLANIPNKDPIETNILFGLKNGTECLLGTKLEQKQRIWSYLDNSALQTLGHSALVICILEIRNKGELQNRVTLGKFYLVIKYISQHTQHNLFR